MGTEGIKSQQARTSSRGLVPENENRVSLGKKKQTLAEKQKVEINNPINFLLKYSANTASFK